jgi:hypothetical protein
MKQSYKTNFIFVLFIFGLKSFSPGQTTIPFSDDFEGTPNWTIVNGAATNGWYLGTATGNSPSHSMYISDDGGLTNAYNEDSISVVHFYKDFIIPSNLCAQLSFFKKGMGEFSFDYLKVYAAPVSILPQAGAEVSAAYLVGGPYLGDSIYTSATISISSFAGDTMRLIFSWKNDGSDGTQPPASVDDIQITGNTTAANDVPCNAVTVTLGNYISGNNTCSTDYDEPLPPPCFVNPNASALNTVWYKFTAPFSGCIKIKTYPANFNAQIALYGGIPGTIPCDSGGTLNYIACNDNSDLCPGGIVEPGSLLSVDSLVPGLTYYLVVDGYQNITGSFSLLFIDGGANCTNDFPPVFMQDCVLAGLICSYQVNIPDPGYQGVGNVCDFGVPVPCTGGTGGCGPCVTSCLCSGERASAWYKLHIIGVGLLQFDIVPNDWTGGTGCCSTDYDFAVYQIASGGNPGPASCGNLISPLRCSYSALGVTGIYGIADGVSPPAYPGYGAAYRRGINVVPGDSILIDVSNFANSTSGFMLSFANTPAGVIDLCTSGIPGNPGSPVSLFTIFPGIFTDESDLTLKLNKAARVKIELFNITGQQTDDQAAGEIRITLSKKLLHLSPGFYFIRATVNNEQLVKKMVVQ